MANSSWYADGKVSGYDAAIGDLNANAITLATNGMVDSNSVTRLQYPVTSATPDTGSAINATAFIRLSYSDYNFGVIGGVKVYAFMGLAPVSAFAGTPTPKQVMDHAKSTGLMFPSFEATFTPPIVDGFVNIPFAIPGFRPDQVTANSKYWVVVMPMYWKSTNPVTSATYLASSFSTELGRGVSVWSNRTPAAPIITSPSPSSVVASGSNFTLTLDKNDPDEIFGGTSPNYTDVAGVQVQYAPRPTVANPNPAWTDLPFADAGGVLRKGWWIKGASANVAGEGLAALVTGNTVQVRCGSTSAPAGLGLLPSGSWQIRVRVFDFGHPKPAAYNPLGWAWSAGNYSPSNYPAPNVSPWSTPVIVTVSAQVPAPVPIWPVDNTAVPEGTDINLSWQYRNTAQPPFAQARRTVRIRKVGDAAWHYLANDQASSSQTISTAGFTLVSGNLYEWEAFVEDTDGKESSYSETARFWAVPVPNSGEVRPVPAATIDGATLGCGDNRVFVYRRGGKVRVAELTGASLVEWSRVRDDRSIARIVINSWDVDCGNLLSILEPWAYEIVIVRDNGYSKDRVWEGPISLITYQADKVEIDAKDVMNYAYRRIIKQKMSDTAAGDTVTSRAARVLQNVFAPDDPNVLQYLTVLTRSDDAMEYRSTPAYSRTAFEEIDDMAANAGLDYTCVGRSILLWGTKHRIGTLPEFRDKDLGNTPIVSVYGMSMANRYVVSDGNGIWGEATRLNEFGEDPDYGLVEMLSSSWASDSAPESGTYTETGLQTVIESFEGYAERSISDRYPNPVVVRVPDNTTVSPDAVVSIQQLVPGVVIPLRSTGTLRTVVANQKLDSIKVTQTGEVETITITMSPFSRDDNETEGGDE